MWSLPHITSSDWMAGIPMGLSSGHMSPSAQARGSSDACGQTLGLNHNGKTGISLSEQDVRLISVNLNFVETKN